MKNKETINLTDLIDVKFLQEFQDDFASATDICTVIIDKSGAITTPSNFRNFCKNPEKKDSKYNICDIKWEEITPGKKKYLSYTNDLGVINFVLPIRVYGEHIASILGCQVTTPKFDEKKLKEIVKIIGNDKKELIEALKIIKPKDTKPIKNLLNIAANSISQIATKNFELKKKNKKEAFFKKIIKSIKNFSDIEKTFNPICNLISELFDVERVAVVEFCNKTDLGKFNIKKEYKIRKNIKSPQDIKGFKKIGKFLGAKLSKSAAPLIFDNVAKSKSSQFFKDFYKDMGVKSLLWFPITFKGKLWGAFTLSTLSYYNHWTEEHIKILEDVTDQISIAINQSQLCSQKKELAKKKTLLKEDIQLFKYNTDIEKIKKHFLEITRNYFNADSCLFSTYDEESKEFLPIEMEQRKSNRIKSLIGLSIATETPEFRTKLKKRKSIVIKDLQKTLERREFPQNKSIQTLIDIRTKSYYEFLIKYDGETLGTFIMHFSTKPKVLNHEEFNLLKMLIAQVEESIFQAKLIKENEQTAQNEKVLRRILLSSINTFDFAEIINSIVIETGKFFKADRCFYIEIEHESTSNRPIKRWAEYLSSPDILSHLVIQPSKAESGVFIEQTGKYTRSVFCSDIRKEVLPDATRNMLINVLDVKSYFILPIYSGNISYGGIVCHFVKEFKYFTKNDLYMTKAIANQASIAIHQAELYQKQKYNAEKQKLLRDITDTIRNSINIDEIENKFVTEIGKRFDADRVFISRLNPVTNNLLQYSKNSEYISGSKVKSTAGLELNSVKAYENILTSKGIIKFHNYRDFIKEHRKEIDENYFYEYDIKSCLAIPILYKEIMYGIFVIQYTRKNYGFIDEEIDLIKILTDQAGIAFYQAELYENQKKLATKEGILKDIISEIKLTRNLHQAYEKLLKKLAQIFTLNRTLFLEFSKINPEELDVKYEYTTKFEDVISGNITFPQACIGDFLNLINNLQPLILNDVSHCYTEENDDFLKNYKIKSLLSFPLVKYNKEVKVLGFIVLCSDKSRVWTSEEIELMKGISDAVVSVIWEIAKFIETEELRDSFVSTLAHDFQVPLIGEKIALEYMMKYLDKELGENSKIIKEIFENNQNIIELLNKSLDIYTYESGKKKLNLLTYNIDSIINEAIVLSKRNAENKKIKFNLSKSDHPFFVKVDKREFLNVFGVLIENAVKHSPEKEHIKIKYAEKNNRIIVSISNKGKSIPIDIQEKLFNRYEMAQAVERKIGAGTSLFLAKRIVEAHKGNIWFDTDNVAGTTFYVALPYSTSKNKDLNNLL